MGQNSSFTFEKISHSIMADQRWWLKILFYQNGASAIQTWPVLVHGL